MTSLRRRRLGVLGLGVASLLTGVIAGAGCSGGSGGGGDGGEAPLVSERISFPVGSIASGVPFAAGVTTYRGFTVALPPLPTGMGLHAWKIDLQATLPKLHVVNLGAPLRSRALAAVDELVIEFSTALPAGTVCDDRVAYRPVRFVVDGTWQPVSVIPAEATASAQTMERISSGPFTYCVRANFPFDALVTLDEIVVDLSRHCGQAAADIVGRWTGTFSCQAVTCSSFTDSGPVTFDITRDVARNLWRYVDGEAVYQGTVCGSTFAFTRNDATEIECGILDVNVAAGTAVKTSVYYEASNPSCYGKCTDQVHRVPVP